MTGIQGYISNAFFYAVCFLIIVTMCIQIRSKNTDNENETIGKTFTANSNSFIQTLKSLTIQSSRKDKILQKKEKNMLNVILQWRGHNSPCMQRGQSFLWVKHFPQGQYQYCQTIRKGCVLCGNRSSLRQVAIEDKFWKVPKHVYGKMSQNRSLEIASQTFIILLKAMPKSNPKWSNSKIKTM